MNLHRSLAGALVRCDLILGNPKPSDYYIFRKINICLNYNLLENGKYEKCNQTIILQSSLQILGDKINSCVLSSSLGKFRCTKSFCVSYLIGTY